MKDETSPYLRQHADNPVDWHAWGDAAFEEARRRDVPVLLSVGYSACHWCHVMAHESFEDDAIAARMNELFVNVKVDREERPDVDAIYMDAVQAMTGRGGWPMTVFLDHDGRPFWGGTYFPPVSRGGMPGFGEVCQAVDEAWRERRDDVDEQATQLTTAITGAALLEGADDIPGPAVLDAAYANLRQAHDDEWGGFGGAPKFPQAMNLEVLLRAYARNRAEATLRAATTTLDAMASGGMYDHLGGGFARYSVDAIWLVPHFEKMLYDQALLARAYTHAWLVTGADRYRQVVEETIGYVLRDLRHPGGGLYCAEDADSEGVEGKFYVWTPDEIRAVLGADADAAIEWYGVSDEGNFEGATILNRIPHRGDWARPPEIEAARAALFSAREARVRPGLDDKVLTEWNGLMVAALAEAGAAFGRADWLAAAEQTADFLVANLRRDDGRWLRSWQADGGARVLAFATDHGALADAFCRLAEATGASRWHVEARSCADALIDRFWDHERGGVFTTGDDAEALVARPKDLMDNATPSANSLAAVALLRLAALSGEPRYRQHGEDVLRLLAGVAARQPTAFGHLLAAVDLATGRSTEIVVAGDRPDLVRVVHDRYLPHAVLAWGEPFDSPLWDGRAQGNAYVCTDFTCRLPVSTPQNLAEQLDEASR